MKAWKLKDIPALEETISDDYRAVNFPGKVSDKKNEIATAKENAEWASMTVDEIHTRIFGNTAIASGFISVAMQQLWLCTLGRIIEVVSKQSFQS